MLADATGKALIVHTLEQARASRRVSDVLCATDDERIAATVRRAGFAVILTRADHPNGSSRLAEAARGRDEEIIVNVQGDEPEIDSASIDLAVDALLADQGAVVSTLAAPLKDRQEIENPNVVKVVEGVNRRALYFSRAAIPFDRDPRAAHSGSSLRHVGLYVYRAAFLQAYVTLAPTPLEQRESLEQLRILEHGHAIALARVQDAHAGIDTPDQYEAFVRRWNARRGLNEG